MGDWTFFSNYGHVLVCLARDNRARLRDVARDVGITERAVQKIVKDLQEAGYIAVRKQGRCNRYRINRRKSLRHGLESHVTVSRLLALVAPAGRIAEDSVPEDAFETSAPTAPEPKPKPKPEPEPEPEPEPAKPSTAAEASTSKEPSSGKEKKEETGQVSAGSETKNEPDNEEGQNGPLDVKQQGSLF